MYHESLDLFISLMILVFYVEIVNCSWPISEPRRRLETVGVQGASFAFLREEKLPSIELIFQVSTVKMYLFMKISTLLELCFSHVRMCRK